MALPSLTKSWTFSVNQRITFVSLNDAMATFLYGMKNFLVATMGYTVKYTCDGTTGPTNASDHTDRWASKANATTRGANVTTANSFAVLTDGNGVDICFSYVGASDDIARISFSAGGLYTPAGTTNQTPTATDESILATGITIVNSSASLDRVFHMQASTDKKIFRVWIYRSNTLIQSFYFEQVNSVVSAMSFSPSFCGVQTSFSTPTAGSVGANVGHVLGGEMSNAGILHTGIARINATNVNLSGGGEEYRSAAGSDAFATSSPELQAASPIVPVVFASNAGTLRGKVGNRIDAWFPYTNGIAQGDSFGSLQFAFLGTGMWPWDGTNTVQTT